MDQKLDTNAKSSKTNTEIRTNGGSAKGSTELKTVNWMASLMVIQLTSKFIHFSINTLIARVMSPGDYGISTLQFPFVFMAITRLMKEALHRSALREKEDDEVIDFDQTNSPRTTKSKDAKLTQQTSKTHSIHSDNLVLLWWAIPCCIVLSSLLGYWFISWSPILQEHPWMIRGCLCWLIAAWVEISVEPIVIYAESKLMANVTLIVECTSLLLQALGTAVMVYTLDSAALLSSYGQLIYALSLFSGYYIYAFVYDREIGRSIIPESFRITGSMIKSAIGFIMQSVGKYATAEGEHALLFFLATPQQQGVYEFVHNLGSIIPRILFSSFEKTAFIMFARQKNNEGARLTVWTMLLNGSLMISLLYIATCPSYVFFVVNLIYKQEWSHSEAPSLLILYGFYLLLIGINGLVEAHKDAVSPNHLIRRQAPFVFGFVGVYLVIGAACLNFFGVRGLIIASCISTIIRIVFNTYFFSEYLLPISKGIPTVGFWIVWTAVAVIGAVSHKILGDTWNHLAVGAASAGLVAIWFAFFSRKQLMGIYRMVRSKNKSE
mmetsp:Transcript_29906/g.42036  ORF Transcript_29906/g.42036 Transcript_29906/m.42036 type:complete len:549 (+) Transcript_29906:107-1753(+)